MPGGGGEKGHMHMYMHTSLQRESAERRESGVSRAWISDTKSPPLVGSRGSIPSRGVSCVIHSGLTHPLSRYRS